MLRVRAFAAVGLLTALTLSAKSQTNPATGLYRFGSFDSRGFDTINIGNLNTHFEIPIVEKAGRGINFDYRIVYDGLIWSPTSSSGAATFTPDPDWGFRGQLNGGLVGYLTYRQATSFGAGGGACPRPPNYSGQVPTSTTDHFVYHDPYGVNHSFYLSIKACPLSLDDPTITGDGSSSDGSGFKYGLNDGYVHTVTGSIIQPPTLAASNDGKIIDSNGNYVTNNGNGTFTDSLGVTALTISGGGNASSPRTLTYNVARQVDGSTTATVTMSYHTYTVATNFGCTNSLGNPIGNYGPLQNDLLDRITLADGTYYQFNYEDTPGVAGAKTGRLASVTLPTGGTITYQYSDGCNGNGLNSDGSVATLTRTADGARTYNHTVSSATASSTSIQDELGNQSNYSFTIFNGFAYETRRQVYQGAASGTPLLDLKTCYNGAAPDCSAASLTQAIGQVDTYETLDGTKQHGKTMKYNYGLLTEEDDYDYGDASSRGGLLRKEVKVYQAAGSATVLTADNVYDGGGTHLSGTNYGYDETTGTGHAPLQQTSNLPQHCVSGTSCPNGSRGNLTTISRWDNTTNTYMNSAYSYDDAGQKMTATDARGYTTTFSYDNADAYPKDINYPTPNSGVAIKTSTSYDSSSGLLLSSTDPNNQVTSYVQYDRLLRPLEIDYPDGGKTNYSYPSANEVTATILATPDPAITSRDITDGYGRSYQHVQAGMVTETSYDSNGRIHCITNPYIAGSAAPTDGSTCITYDSIGRPTSLIQQDGATTIFGYAGNTTTTTDPATHATKRTIDGIGRLTKVVEQGNLTTLYLYSGFISQIQQQGAPGNTTRFRDFYSDSRSNLVKVATPESGTTTYTYDANGNLSSMTDARGVKRSYAYDSLNRLIGKTFSDGTPSEGFGYDAPNQFYPGSTNVVGRLYWSYSPYRQAKYYSYDAIGRVTFQGYSLPSDQGTPQIDGIKGSYDLAGNLTNLWYPDGRHITQSFNDAGQLDQVVYADWQGSTLPGQTGIAYVSGIAYDASGAVAAQTLGNGVNQTFSRNSRLRLADQSVFAGSKTYLHRQYCYGPTGSINSTCPTLGLDVGNLLQIRDLMNGSATQAFFYDDKNRITEFKRDAGAIDEHYTLDAFGNLGQSTTLGAPSCCDANNHITQSGYGYDAAGNLTQISPGMGVQTISYDAEGQLTNFNNGAATYVYDADNQMIRRDSQGTWKEYLRFGNRILTEKNSDGTWSDYIYANGQRIVKADTFDKALRISGTSTASGGYAWFYLNGNAGLTNYTIKAGDALYLRDIMSGPINGAVAINMTDGSSIGGLTDQDGYPTDSDSVTGAWHMRRIDLTTVAGHQIDHILFGANYKQLGNWHVSFADASIVSADGTVYPLYTGQSSAPLSLAWQSNMTNLTNDVATYGTADNTYYYVSDQIGSTQMMLNMGVWPAGNSPNCCSATPGWPVEQDTYFPFGQKLDNKLPNVQNTYQYTGLERDETTGFDHAMFRQYSATTGRWMSPDPYLGSYDFADPQSFNRYVYARNNPLAVVDPTGLSGVCVNVFPYGTAEGYQYSVDPFINNSADCSAAYGTWQETGSDVTVDVDSGPIADPGLGAIAVPPSGSPSSGGGGTGTSDGASAPNKTACNIQRATSGAMGTANLGLAISKGQALGGAIAGLTATGAGAPAAGVLAVYGTVSIFGQGLTGAAQLYSAATGNYGTPARVAQIGNILSGPVSGLGTLLRGGSLADAERNAGYESAFTAGSGLIDAIRAGGVGLPLAMTDHSTAQMSMFGAGGGNACGAGH